MASLDDVVSNLKNVVTNLSGLVTSTAIINSINALGTSINAIGSTLQTSLATVHVIGGTFFVPLAVTSYTVADPHLAANGVVVWIPSDVNSAQIIFNNAPYGTTLSAGHFQIAMESGSTVASGLFSYVGYNP